MQVRPPVLAAQGWYPADEGACRARVEGYLEAARREPADAVLGGIVPHAGWAYSGPTAARSFAALADAAPELVILFGGHLRPGDPVVAMTRGAFGTPLGPLPVDEALAAELGAAFALDAERPDRAAPDNTIELQLPFVRALWPDARVLAVQVPPDDRAAAIGAWLAARTTAQGRRCVALGSTDLTHYGDGYGFTPHGVGEDAHAWSMQHNDRPFLERILALDGDGAIAHALDHHSACCPGAAAATIAFVRARGGGAPRLLEHTTSHLVGKHGPPRLWVGYASAVF